MNDPVLKIAVCNRRTDKKYKNALTEPPDFYIM